MTYQVLKSLFILFKALPTNGEIVFGEASEMTFSGGQKLPVDSKNCAGNVISVHLILYKVACVIKSFVLSSVFLFICVIVLLHINLIPC